METSEKVKLDVLFTAVYSLLKSGLSHEFLHDLVAVCVKNNDVIQFCREHCGVIVSEVSSAVEKSINKELQQDLCTTGLYGLVFVRCGAFDDAVYITYVKNNQLIVKYLLSFKKDMPSPCFEALTSKLEKLGLTNPYEKFVSATVDRDCFHSDEINTIVQNRAGHGVLTFASVIYKLESVLGRDLQRSMQDDPQVAIIVNLCNMLKNLALADDLNLGDMMFVQKCDALSNAFFNYRTLVTIHEHWFEIVTKLDRILVDSLVEDDQQVISVILATLKSTSFIVNLSFYIELFYCLHRLSEKILSHNMPIYQIINELEGTSDTIRHYTSTGGSKVDDVLNVLQSDVGKYKGVVINCDLDQDLFLSTMQRVCGFVSDIIDDVVRKTSGIIRQFSALDPKLWPTDKCDLEGFGYDAMKSFSKKYGESRLKNVDIFQEWGSYKRTVQNSLSADLQNNFNNLAAKVISSYKSMYPGIGTLLSMAVLLCPASETVQLNTQLISLNDFSEELKTILVNGPPTAEWKSLNSIVTLLQDYQARTSVKFSEEDLRGVEFSLEELKRLFGNSSVEKCL
ncbi:uncharacterized protein LOC135370126 [Ornithodoros turicata]|uniref:uncharacterized protein LOC135370126 n=1 Tax=Ornithodoros turicata TaxID=34597 RepID=UPI00313A10E6